MRRRLRKVRASTPRSNQRADHARVPVVVGDLDRVFVGNEVGSDVDGPLVEALILDVFGRSGERKRNQCDCCAIGQRNDAREEVPVGDHR